MSDCRLQAQTPATTYLSITQANTPDPKFSIMCSSAARSVAHAVMTLEKGSTTKWNASGGPHATGKAEACAPVLAGRHALRNRSAGIEHELRIVAG